MDADSLFVGKPLFGTLISLLHNGKPVLLIFSCSYLLSFLVFLRWLQATATISYVITFALWFSLILLILPTMNCHYMVFDATFKTIVILITVHHICSKFSSGHFVQVQHTYLIFLDITCPWILFFFYLGHRHYRSANLEREMGWGGREENNLKWTRSICPSL